MKTLNDCTREELKAIADTFGSSVTLNMPKAKMVGTLKEDGVTYEDYEKLLAALGDDPMDEVVPTSEGEVVAEIVDYDGELEVVPAGGEPPSDYLVKMTRPNFTYEIRGYKFTKQHPFALVDADDADYLIEVVGGFRGATPREATEFYGRI